MSSDLPALGNKYIQAARVAALASPGAGGKNGYRLGAIIVNTKTKTIEAAKFNCLKSHPKLCKHFKYPYLHAEAHAILSLGLFSCLNKIMYVVRVKRDGSYAMAKPCKSCQNLIKEVGIKDVYYSTSSTIEKLSLKRERL